MLPRLQGRSAHTASPSLLTKSLSVNQSKKSPKNSKCTPNCETSASAHQPTERFRVVPGMEHDESHAFQHALLNSVDQGVTDLLMGNMPPPEEYLGILEERIA